VRLPGKALTHVFESPSEIIENIRKFYVNETLKQIYKIVGSLDLVGNPTMLVSSFVSGVRDLVVAPSMAFLKTPTDPSRVGLGVAQGTLSLVSYSVSGFFGVLAKVSARAGQGVAILSLDGGKKAREPIGKHYFVSTHCLPFSFHSQISGSGTEIRSSPKPRI